MGQWTRTSYFLEWIFPTYWLHFPHSARGGAWETDLVLLNPSGDQVTATIKVFNSAGDLRAEESSSLLEWSLLERRLPNQRGTIEVGAVVVSSPKQLSGFLRITSTSGHAISVQPTHVGNGFVVPVSPSANRVGVAVFNASTDAAVVTFRTGRQERLETIPPNGSVSWFVDEFFSTPQRLIKIQSANKISVLTLELVGSKFVTLPATRIE